jgi:hypothetical protein
MIINNLNILGSIRSPTKADTELVIDPNTPLPLSISLERFKPIARRHAQIIK